MADSLAYYAKKYGRTSYIQFHDTLDRCGELVPVDGWRISAKGSRFYAGHVENPNSVKCEKDINDHDSFASSRYMEQASPIKGEKGTKDFPPGVV